MSCYTSLSAGEASVVPVCLCCRYVSELSIPQRRSPAALIGRGLLLIKQVRLGLLTARRLASRHIFSAGLGLICMRGVCEDGWMDVLPARWHWPIFCVWPRSCGCINRKQLKSACCEHRSLHFPTARNTVGFNSFITNRFFLREFYRLNDKTLIINSSKKESTSETTWTRVCLCRRDVWT